jgi:hypothetical protein
VSQEKGVVPLNLLRNVFYATTQKKAQFHGQYQIYVKVIPDELTTKWHEYVGQWYRNAGGNYTKDLSAFLY